MSSINITPAYGRDYTSGKAAIADLEAGKDFQIADIGSPYNGSYITLSEARDSGIQRITIRYKRLTAVTSYSVKTTR